MRKTVLVTAAVCSLFVCGSAWAAKTPPAAKGQSAKTMTPAQVAAQVRDSVASIDANSIVYNAIFVGGSANTRIQKSKVTGFVYTSDGYIITDARQVSKDSVITVYLPSHPDGLPAQVIDSDTDYGVAVLKVNTTEKLKPVKLDAGMYDSDKGVYPYSQGDPVIAIGDSGGYQGTVTEGIISAVRNFRNSSGMLIPNMIQADCVINLGNQGCPLFNDRGEVIAMHDRQGTGNFGLLQRTTFFTPVWLVKRVADEMIANHQAPTPEPDFKVWHPWLGIEPYSAQPGAYDELKMFIDWPDQYWDTGIWIDTVWPDSPAAQAGIKDRDILYSVSIVRLDDKGNEHTVRDYQYLKSVEQLETMVTTASKGDHFIFGVYRNGHTQSREVEIAQHPGAYTTTLLDSQRLASISSYF